MNPEHLQASGRPQALTAGGANVLTGLKELPNKSKAASIKLTLAAVGLDAYELLRSGACSLHDKERRDVNGAPRLEVGTPKRGAADFTNLFEFVLHQFLKYYPDAAYYVLVFTLVPSQFSANSTDGYLKINEGVICVNKFLEYRFSEKS